MSLQLMQQYYLLLHTKLVSGIDTERHKLTKGHACIQNQTHLMCVCVSVQIFIHILLLHNKHFFNVHKFTDTRSWSKYKKKQLLFPYLLLALHKHIQCGFSFFIQLPEHFSTHRTCLLFHFFFDIQNYKIFNIFPVFPSKNPPISAQTRDSRYSRVRLLII